MKRHSVSIGRFIGSLPDRIGRPTSRTAYIPEIDGLRFLAILLVFLWHASLRATRFINTLPQYGIELPNLYAWFPHGEVGVALFFVISGYVIAQPFLSGSAAGRRVGPFYWRRFRRIYPPYVIAITICLLLVSIFRINADTSSVPISSSWFASLFYLHGWLYSTSSRLDPPIWSLEIEIQFYLLAPFLMRIYMWPKSATLRVTSGCICIFLLLLAASALNAVSPFDGRFRFGLVAHLHLFLAGIVMADFMRHRAINAETAPLRFDALFAVGMLSLYLVGLYLTQVDARPEGGWAYVSSASALLAAVVAIYFGGMYGRFSRRLMGARWIVLIGTMCYSIYLVHVVVLEAVASKVLVHLPLNDMAEIYLVFIIIPGVVTLFAGGLYYVVVERPFMSTPAQRSRLASRSDRQADVTPGSQ